MSNAEVMQNSGLLIISFLPFCSKHLHDVHKIYATDRTELLAKPYLPHWFYSPPVFCIDDPRKLILKIQLMKGFLPASSHHAVQY